VLKISKVTGHTGYSSQLKLTRKPNKGVKLVESEIHVFFCPYTKVYVSFYFFGTWCLNWRTYTHIASDSFLPNLSSSTGRNLECLISICIYLCCSWICVRPVRGQWYHSRRDRESPKSKSTARWTQSAWHQSWGCHTSVRCWFWLQ